MTTSTLLIIESLYFLLNKLLRFCLIILSGIQTEHSKIAQSFLPAYNRGKKHDTTMCIYFFENKTKKSHYAAFQKLREISYHKCNLFNRISIKNLVLNHFYK